MNWFVGLLALIGLAIVSGLPLTQTGSSSQRQSIDQLIDQIEASHLRFIFKLNRLENDLEKPEKLTKTDLNRMAGEVVKQIASLEHELDITIWLKHRTRLESREWFRINETVRFLVSVRDEFDKLRRNIDNWISLKGSAMPGYPHEPVNQRVPFNRLWIIDMSRYGQNESVVLWKKLGIELKKSWNDLTKMDELADRTLAETGKLMDRVENIWVRLPTMNVKSEEYEKTMDDVELLIIMAKRIYMQHEKAVLRAKKLREMLNAGALTQAPTTVKPTTSATTTTTTKVPGEYVEEISSEDEGFLVIGLRFLETRRSQGLRTAKIFV